MLACLDSHWHALEARLTPPPSLLQAGKLLYSIPLSGCNITVPDPEEGLEAGYVWKLHQGSQTWWLSAPSTKLQQRWLEALSTASRGDTAGDTPGASQPQTPASTDTP